MESLKQRSWLLIPMVACAIAIALIATRASSGSTALGSPAGLGADTSGTLLGMQTGGDVLATKGADWTMDGLNPARTRARQEPFAQPITKQRVVTVPGDTGDGSPPIVSQHMLVVEAPDDLRAVDLATGKQRWRVPLAGTYISPAIADDRVFVRSEASNKGQVIALDLASGKQLWTFAAEHISTAQTGYLGGHVTSPVVSEGRVIIGAGDKVYALDAATGRGLWAFTTKDLITSSATIQDGQIYIADFTHIYALDLATGAQRWSYTTASSISFAPIAADNMVFATNGNNMVALDRTTGQERWTAQYPDTQLVPGAAFGKLVYLKSTHDVYALDSATGKEVWRFRDPSFVSLPAIAGQDMFVVTGMGPASALSAIDTRTGKGTWHMPVANLANTAPIISGQTIYLRTTDGRVVGYWHE